MHNQDMSSLWTPSNWPQRLSELLASTGELKEAHFSVIFAHDEKSYLTLPSGLVKQLEGQNETEVTFKYKYLIIISLENRINY